MPVKDKFQGIVDKVKMTFGLLRDIFSETPPEPNGQPLPFNRLVKRDDKTQVVVSPENQEITQTLSAPEPAPQSIVQEAYLETILANHESVCLPGLFFEGTLLEVPLERVYTPLALMDMRKGVIHPERDDGFYGGAAALSLASAMQRYRRILIIAGSGAGKTWLLRTLALAYARSMLKEKLEKTALMPQTTQVKFVPLNKQRLITAEEGVLPVLISLRALGNYLSVKSHKSVEGGPAKLLNFLRESLLPSDTQNSEDFFEQYFSSGKAIVMLDGLDEVGEVRLRRRIVGLIEEVVKHFPDCRYIVTSRPINNTGTALIGEQFGTLRIRPFSSSEVRKFSRAWSLILETCRVGDETAEVQTVAKQRAEKLCNFIEENHSFAELAVGPFILILLAFVQRSHERWPVHRADLLDLAVDAMLRPFHAARQANLGETVPFAQRHQDQIEIRRSLEMLAFWSKINIKAEFNLSEMSSAMLPWLTERAQGDETRASCFLEIVQQLVTQNSHLFIENRLGYCFSQRLLQDFLAGHALADRDDTLAYTHTKLSDSCWRDVICLEAGILNGQANYRTSELLQFILDANTHAKLQPYNTTFLAVECLNGLDISRMESSFQDDLKKCLKKQINLKIQSGDSQVLMNRFTANNAMARIFGGQSLARFWKPPYGEPEWVTIPAGPFWMGGTGKDAEEGESFIHQVTLPEYQISRTPVTNAQFALFINDTSADPPEHWYGRLPPREIENHPVTNVNWHEAMAYCAWLSEKTNLPVNLPSEAEWEKAARGDQDQREYPWGNWDELHANTSELGLGETTPVGLFSNGSSPYGLLDMAGNVREWTRSLADFGYPYDPTDKAREDPLALDDQARVQRGGSYYFTRAFAGCAQRQRYYPDFRFYNFGFRVVTKPTAA